MPQGQVTEAYASDTHPLQAGDAQTDQFAHAPDLTLATFGQDKAQLLGIGPGHLGRAQLLAIELEAMIEQRQAARVKRTLDANQVFLFHHRIIADQLACDAAILGQDQQSGGIDVEPAGRCQTFQMGKLKALRVPGHLGFRRDQADGRLVTVFGLTGNITHRLVHQQGRLPGLRRARFRREGNQRRGRRPGTELGDALAIDKHQPALDIRIGLAPRAQAALGKKFGNPDTRRIIHGYAFYPAPMLSYRHAYHAGNHADVLKHLVLMHCIEHMNSKDKPYTVVDTHAGAGFYALDDEHAKRTGEYIGGIGRLWERKDLPPPLAEYVAVVRALNGSATLRRYPGSPRIAAELMRDSAQVRDTLRLCELHSTDFALLRRQFKDAGRRIAVEQADGFEVLKAALPPPSRRGMVLIDPSYEIKSDYMKVTAAIKDALKRFATGTYLVWHPMLPTIEANQLPGKLKKLAAGHWLYATLSVRAASGSGRGMYGSGMFVINPPWTLAAMLEQCLPWLAGTLALDQGADWQVTLAEETPAQQHRD